MSSRDYLCEIMFRVINCAVRLFFITPTTEHELAVPISAVFFFFAWRSSIEKCMNDLLGCTLTKTLSDKPSVFHWVYLPCGNRGIHCRSRDPCPASKKAAAPHLLEVWKSLWSSSEICTPEWCCYEIHWIDTPGREKAKKEHVRMQIFFFHWCKTQSAYWWIKTILYYLIPN